MITDANWAISFAAPQFKYGNIMAMTFDDHGNLYVGGFLDSPGTGAADYIAKWDGTNWSALGSGTDDYVLALLADKAGNLYAGGVFYNAGGTVVKGVAKWDGTNWSALGSGVGDSGWVGSLAMDQQGNLYAGGFFTPGGGGPGYSVARWDGTNWYALGGGITGIPTEAYEGPDVNALAVDASGKLYAGGAFTTAGTATVNSLAVWNGVSWSPVGTGLSGGSFSVGIPTPQVFALLADTVGNVYVCGAFTNAGGISANSIAQWNGYGWSTFGTGVFPFVAGINSLALDASGHLYAGGTFVSIGGVSARNIAEWDGSGWNALGNGLYTSNSASANANSLVFDPSGNLDVGGAFTMAGTNTSYSIAQVLLSPASYGLTLQHPGPGTNIIRGFGTPNYAYALDMATNLASPVIWMPQVTNTQTNVNLMFTNTTTLPRAYYRTRYVPQ